MKDFENCPHCNSTNLIRQVGANEPTRHYGRLICGDCDKWIKWIPKPKPSVIKATEGKVSVDCG